jgi:hypothetical protein
MTMLCISKEKRIGWLKVLKASFNDSSVIYGGGWVVVIKVPEFSVLENRIKIK